MTLHRGLDDPGDELRPVAGLVEPLVLGVEDLAIASRWRPNALTIAWPGVHLLDVALSAPVEAHWATNCRCDRRTMRIVTTNEAGTASSETTARIGLIVSIMISDADDRQQRRDELGQGLLERLADVVDVVGDAAQQVAARVRVEVAQRQAAELRVDAPRGAGRPSGW